MRKLTRNLAKKSNAAFLLALELFNKPTIEYRTESFCVLFTNAWELALKANLYETSRGVKSSIYRKKKKNQPRESISIDECLDKIFLNSNDPIRKNIEFISELRNEATHLIIKELDPFFSRIFQKGVEYYIEFVRDNLSIDINQNLKPGLMSLITDKDQLTDIPVLKPKFNKEDFDSILPLIERFKELHKIGAAIPISYSLAIVKNPKKGDFVISSDKSGSEKVVIIEKQKDPDRTHPFNRKAGIYEIKKRTPRNIKFTEYDFESYVFVKGHKKSNNEYFYKGKYSGAGQYSQKFIDEFVQGINSNAKKFLEEKRSQYRQHLRSSKK